MEDDESEALAGVGITRYHSGGCYPADDLVAVEEPVEVRLNGSTLAFLMRLPGDDRLLAVGFCFSEGLIGSREQIELIEQCDGSGPGEGSGNLVEIKTKDAPDLGRFGSPRVVRTGCGGADVLGELDISGLSVEGGAVFSPGIFPGLPGALLEHQEVFRATGGTHGAGLFEPSGRVLVVKEDVGRHNAVDKVLGYLLLTGEPAGDKGLILSGRLSYEMVLKCARAGIPLACSVSAPTRLGVELGARTGVTLVGFLRGEGYNVYSHPERIGAV